MSDKLAELKAKQVAKHEATNAKIKETLEAGELKLFELAEEMNLEIGRDIAAVFATNTGKVVIVKKPSTLVFKSYSKVTRNLMAAILTGNAPKDDADHDYDLVKQCLVYPTIQEVTAMIEETPSIIAHASGAVQRLAGEVIDGIEGK